MILSQIAFALGARGGLARILMPAAVNSASKEPVNWPARSLIRNLTGGVPRSKRQAFRRRWACQWAPCRCGQGTSGTPKSERAGQQARTDAVRVCPQFHHSEPLRSRTYSGRACPPRPRSTAYAQVRRYTGVSEQAVCKTVGLAYVGSNPTPATQNPRSERLVRSCVSGSCAQEERFGRPFPVAVGQLWARSGLVSGSWENGCPGSPVRGNDPSN